MEVIVLMILTYILLSNCFHFQKSTVLTSFPLPLSSSSSLPSRFSSLSYIDVNASRLIQAERQLSNEFNRFIFLRDFLDVNPVYHDDDYNNDCNNMNFPIKPYIRIDDNIDIPTHTPKQSYKLESCNDIDWYYHYYYYKITMINLLLLGLMWNQY